MTGQDLKNSILQLAIQGKLVEQREEEGNAKELIKEIKAEKERLIKEKKIRKEKPLPEIGEDEMLFDIPQSWEWVRLQDLCVYIKAGGDKPKDFLEYKTETHTVPVIANGERNKGIIGYTREATVTEPALTVSGRGTIGFSCLRSEPFTPIVRLLVLNITNGTLRSYIKIVLTSLLEEGVGTSIQQLTVPMIKPKIIPLPPLEEQKRIVEMIEELMPYIDNYGETHIKLEELNKNFPTDMQNSILQYAIQGKLVEQREEEGSAEELYKEIQEEKEKLIKEGKIRRTKTLAEISEDEIPFDIPESWKWVRLGNLISITSGKGLTKAKMREGNIPVYGGNGITGFHNKPLLKEETVVIGRVGYYCGSVHITEKLSWVTDNAFITSYPQQYINREYLVYTLRQMDLGRDNKATAQPVVSGKKIYPLLFPLPPLEEQKRIVEKIEELLPLCKELKQ